MGGLDGQPSGDAYEWFHRGLDLLDRGDAAAAAELLRHALEAEPGAESVREALARALFDARRYPEAADVFREITLERPSEDYSRFGLGLSLVRLGSLTEGIEHLALAVAMNPARREYVDALTQARATQRARARTGPWT